MTVRNLSGSLAFAGSIILMILSLNAIAQPRNQIAVLDTMVLRQYTEYDGVNNSINSMFQDRQGYMWFGSFYDGLYRFDGYEFKHYEFDPNDSLSIPNNLFHQFIKEDSKGNLWIRAGGKLYSFDRKNNVFVLPSLMTHDPEFFYTWGNILAVAEAQDGSYWLGALEHPFTEVSGGLLRYYPEEDRISIYRYNPEDSTSLSSNCISSVFIDSNETLWIGTCNGGIDRLIPSDGKNEPSFMHCLEGLGTEGDQNKYSIIKIFEDPDNNIWAGNREGILLKYVKSDESFQRYPVLDENGKQVYVNNLSFDREGNFWLSTSEGIGRYEDESDDFILYSYKSDGSRIGRINHISFGPDGHAYLITNENDLCKRIYRFSPSTGQYSFKAIKAERKYGLRTNSISGLHAGHNGIVWITSTEGGIFKYDPGKEKFRDAIPELRPDLSILCICMDMSEQLWFGTDRNGLFCYNKKSGKLSQFKHNPDDQQSLGSNSVHSLNADSSGNIWVGTLGGLNRININNSKIEKYTNEQGNEEYRLPNQVGSISPGLEDLLWIGTLGGGLYSFDTVKKEFSAHYYSKQNTKGPNANTILSLYADPDGNVWMGTFYGLHRYRPVYGNHPAQHEYFIYSATDIKSIGSNIIGRIIPGKPGELWIGAIGGGLNKMDINSGKFTRFTRQDGMSNNIINSLIMDDRGQVWSGTNHGLNCLDPSTGSILHYDYSSGIKSVQFNYGAIAKGHDGEIYIANVVGITRFHPDSLSYNSIPPEIVFTKFKINDTFEIHNFDKPITLKYNENFLTLEFAALNFTNTSKNQYKYRMVGIDRDTIEAGTDRKAVYTDIKPGSYRFWVSGSNNNGIWNDEGISLSIRILPPWWQSTMAKIIYVLLSAGAVIAFIAWRTWKFRYDRIILERTVKERTHIIEERDRQLLEMDQMKTRFFANISHEFRTPLTLILSHIDDLRKNKVNKEKQPGKLDAIKRNGLRLLDLANQLLSLSKLDSGKLILEVEECDVVEMTRRICATFYSIAEKKKITFITEFPESDFITYIDISKTESIITNLISNAFNFTPEGGEIIFKSWFMESPAYPGVKQLNFEVTDNGQGIELSEQKRIFERFYQAQNSSKIQAGGAGIGLSLTKEFIELIHGEISVVSEPGKGSSFRVALPLGLDFLNDNEYRILEKPTSPHDTYKKPDEQTDISTAEDYEYGVKPHLDSLHLLIVEDNKELRSYLAKELMNEFLIAEAPNGEEGLEQALNIIPDLIITDVMMPGMDGVEFCKKIKTNEKTSHIPVIILTARADDESKMSGLETGADDYILKPFDIKEVRVRIRNLIKQRINLREYFSNHKTEIPEETMQNSYDVKFLRRLIKIISHHLSDIDFDIGVLQDEMGLSHSQLYRKLQALSGQTPTRFIRRYRLKHAAELIEKNEMSITEIALAVGFGNISYFTKCFREEFGIPPSKYRKSNT